jgi:hypothetical protein
VIDALEHEPSGPRARSDAKRSSGALDLRFHDGARAAGEIGERLAAPDGLADCLAELDAGAGIDLVVGACTAGAERDGDEAELERVG